MGYEKEFRNWLDGADKGDIDMSWQDWALTLGVAENYGHGMIWNLPTTTETLDDGETAPAVDFEALDKMMAEFVENEETFDGE